MKSVKKLLLAASAFAIFGLGIFGGVENAGAKENPPPKKGMPADDGNDFHNCDSDLDGLCFGY